MGHHSLIAFELRNNKNQNALAKMVSFKSVPRKIAKLLKKGLLISHLRKYEELPIGDTHQEEVDENAINEALEARLMEMIASAPQHNLEEAWTLKVPANLDNLPTFQTYCQVAQAQV